MPPRINPRPESTPTSQVSTHQTVFTLRRVLGVVVAILVITALGFVGSATGVIRPMLATGYTATTTDTGHGSSAVPAHSTTHSSSRAVSEFMHEFSVPISTPTTDNATVPTPLSAGFSTPNHQPSTIATTVRTDPCRHKKCVALTFDDGPGPYTTTLLKTLKKHHVHATFFLIGNRVSKWSKVARAEVKNGNEICGHSWSHKDLGRMSKAKIQRDTSKVKRAIVKATGVTITCMRPPYGALSAKQAKYTGLKNYLWNVDTLDWKTLNTKKTIKAATKHIRSGSVIIMHDIHKTTVKAIPTIIKRLKHKGFTLTTVDGVLAKDHPTAGHKYFER